MEGKREDTENVKFQVDTGRNSEKYALCPQVLIG